MKIEYSIGLRYTRSKKRNRFIGFISLIAAAGVAVGVLVVITVLSVMNGFKVEVRDKMLAFASHATVTGFDGRLEDWRPLERLVAEHPDILALAPFVEAQTMLAYRDRTHGVYLRGILPEREAEVSEIADHVVAGSLDGLVSGGFFIVLGESLARSLGVGVGDKVTIISTKAAVTPIGIRPRLRRFTVGGIFKMGMPQYDRNVAFVQLNDAQRLMQLGESVSGVHLRLQDLLKAPEVTHRLKRELSPDYWASDWTQRHKAFFRAIEMEKTILMIIMTLIIVVAVFNIVSALIMVVVEKQGDVAILKTLGMTPSRILGIFITQGCVIGGAGVVLGAAGGVALASHLSRIAAWIERAFDYKFLSPDIYPISEVPSQLLASDVIWTMALAFVLTVVATLYPAWRAASVRPAEVLRYE